MLSTSAAFKAAVAQNPNMLFKATLKLANGTTKELSAEDIMEGSQSYTEGVSSDGSFDIGAAIIGKYTLSLNNEDEQFSAYTFDGATITPSVGVKLTNGATSWLQKGIYGVEQPNTYGTVITLSALDNMRLLEKDYSEITTSYPATLDTILRNICTQCGITLATSSFPNKSYVVDARPDEKSLSCLQMVAYITQMAGCWAKCDSLGRLTLGWYSKSFFDATPEIGTYANLTSISNMSVYTDDVVITGVRMTAQNEVKADGSSGNDGESYLYGSDGYVIDLSGNPLCLYGKAKEIATFIGQRTVGLRFRPFNASAIGDPSYEAGDPAIITDAKGAKYKTYISTLTYKPGYFEQFACNAEYPGRNKAASYSAITKTIAAANRAIEREKTAREIALENLARQIKDSATGLFMTVESQPNGSSIYYMHDQPTLEESQIVWKLTANAVAISTDGGNNYDYGVDVNGDAILNRIYAIGINADYIDTGRLEVSDGKGNVRFSADYDTGSVLIQDKNGNMWDTATGAINFTTNVSFGGNSVEQIISASEGAINAIGDVSLLKAGSTNSVDVEYGISSSASTKPTSWYTTANTLWNQKGKFLWTRQKMTMYDGKVKYSTPRLLSDGKQLVKEIREQYYLSTSKTALAGGSWADKQQSYVNGRYYWTRNRIEWANGTVTYEPSVNGELAQAFTSVTDIYDSRLDQKKVFNILTNNGKSQGLFTDSKGNLFVNGTYISTGVLSDKAGRNWWNLNTGDISIMGLSTLEKKVDNLKVGGTNLLNGTAAWTNWVKRRVTVSGEQANFPAQSADWDSSIYSPLATIQYGKVKGKEATISFDVKCSSAWGAVADKNAVWVALELHTTATRSRHKWRAFKISKQPTTSWQRISFTTTLTNALFTSGTGTIADANMLGLEIYNRSNKALQVRRVKMEIGNIASDWCATDYDAQLDATTKANKALSDANANATTKANKALSDAKSYTANEVSKAKTATYAQAKSYVDAISKKDRQYTDQQKKDLSNSLTQAAIFNKLTNNGKIQTLQMSGGKLYINGEYIKTGTLKAGILKAGILSPARVDKGNFQINMETGYAMFRNVELTNMTAKNGIITSSAGETRLQIEGGQLRGYRGTSKTPVCYIDATARVAMKGSKTHKVLKTVNGLQIQSNGTVRISSPYLSVSSTSNVHTDTTRGFTGSVKLKNLTFNQSSKRFYTGSVELKFINGIFIGVGDLTEGLVSKTKQYGEGK